MTSTPRFDVYTSVHKGLRKALFDFGYAIGRTDAEDDARLAALVEHGREVFHFLDEHGENENRYQLALIEAKRPGGAVHDYEEHEEIDAMVRALEHALTAIADAPREQRRAMLRACYGQYHEFVSRYLQHMEKEETETTQILHTLCTDEELAGATQQIIRNTPPHDMAMMMKYMIPSMTPHERLHMMMGMKQGAPAEAFEGIKTLAQSVLPGEEWLALERELA